MGFTPEYPKAGSEWTMGEFVPDPRRRGQFLDRAIISNQVVDRHAVGKQPPRCLQLDDYSTQSYISCYDVGDATNAVRAFVERMIFVPDDTGGFAFPPEPERGNFGPNGNLSGAFRLFSAAPCERHCRMTLEKFVQTSPAHKRKLYAQAAESLRQTPLKPDDSKLKTFLKLEKADYLKKLGVPRLINPRSPRFNVEWGRYVRPIEKRIYAAINAAFGYDIVAKGMNATKRADTIFARWSSFTRPVCIGGDARRFDQHVSKRALEWTHRLYETYFEPSEIPYLRWLARQTIYNRGKLYSRTGVIKWSRTGGRQTGDMDTSLGNIILMCAMLYDIMVWMHVRGHRVEFIDDGDDFNAFMEAESEPLFREASLRFLNSGFEVDLEPTALIIEQVEFCQCRPVKTQAGYKMVRNFRGAIAKDLCVINRSAQEAFSILKAIGVGGMNAYGDIPIFCQHYKRLSKISGRAAKMQTSGWTWLTHDMKSGESVLDETRLSFQRAFGISVHMQLLLEKELAMAHPVVRAEYPSKIQLVRDILPFNCAIPEL